MRCPEARQIKPGRGAEEEMPVMPEDRIADASRHQTPRCLTLKEICKGSIMRLGEREIWISRRFPRLRVAGRSDCVAAWRAAASSNLGPESSGKTTLALHIVAEAQRAGGVRRTSMLNMRWMPTTLQARRQR